MRTKTIRKVLYLVLLLLSVFTAWFLIPSETAVVSAETFENFLIYSGELNNFRSVVYYPTPVTTIAGVNRFNITLYTTEGLSWTIWGPKFKSVIIKMTRPDGSVVEHEMSKNGENVAKEHWSEELFNSNDLKTDDGTVIEGRYTVQATGSIGADLQEDQEQNNSFTFYVNLTEPTITLMSAGSTEALGDGTAVNRNVTVFATDKDCKPKLQYRMTQVGGDYREEGTIESGTTFSKEGRYEVTAIDETGKTTTKSFTIDKTAPMVEAPEGFLNRSFTYKASDENGLSTVYCRFNGEDRVVNGSTYTVERKPENYGVWEFKATDRAGNATEWRKIVLYNRDGFGNREAIRDEYKTATYWTVNLPSRNFPEIAGKYTFGSYEAALSFAKSKEREYRVAELSGGKWSYVNISNDSVAQIYDNKEDLERAIEKYAKANVSERNVLGVTGGNYTNPTTDDGVTKSDALTRQNLKLPSHLSEYSNAGLYFISHKFTFAKPKEGVDGNRVSVTMKYISDGISRQNGKEITIDYGESLEKALKNANAWKQGYYLVTERDLCGNTERYVVCIDSEQPTLSGQAFYGDGRSEEVSFNQGYVTENEGVMLYTGLNLNGIADNLDEYVVITIDGRGYEAERFVNTDELPYLCYENGNWGIYDITVYDRSFNVLTFRIKIAGESPKVRHTSLTNENRCTFTIESGDPYNAITQIRFYKVLFTGEYSEMKEDGDGTPISAENLKYVLRTGGKYVVKIRDVYGREIETEPIFYMKGLPTGILSGVKDGGITNRDVTFEYAKENEVELYVWKGGEWKRDDLKMKLSEKESGKVAEISASAETSFAYKIFLYVEDDKNLFTEYRFEIDCIPPSVEIKSTSDEPIDSEEVTNKSFYVTWSENGLTAYYYNRNGKLGELGQEKYVKGTEISVAGTWFFTVYDSVKNSVTFSVTLDNEVSYAIDGTYARTDDGSYLSNKSLTLSVNEPTSVWEVKSSNGIKPVNGQKIEIDGTYEFKICDRYGNELKIVLIVDNLPPEAVITTKSGKSVEADGKVNEAFTVTCEEVGVTITYAKDNGGYAAYNGELQEETGVYTFILTDRAGNKTILNVTIDKTVDFTVNGNFKTDESGRYVSKSWIAVDVKETCVRFETTNGATVVPGEKITSEGEYTIEIEDVAGNVRTLSIVIDKTPPKAEIEKEDGTEVEENSVIDVGFYVRCEESGVSVRIAGKDLKYTEYDGGLLSGRGKYYFSLTDFVGNEATFYIEFDDVVEYELRGDYIKIGDNAYKSRTAISVVAKEDLRYSSITSKTDGREYDIGTRLNAEGEYEVLLEDENGNKTILRIVIDKTAPKIEVSGVEADGATNGAVTMKVSDYAYARYKIVGSNEDSEFGEEITLTEEGRYTIYAKDDVGNEATVNFIIDKSVDVEVSAEIYRNSLITGEISFKWNETMRSVTCFKDGKEIAYKSGKIRETGEYRLIAEDAVGNEATWEWTIIPGKAQAYSFKIPSGWSAIVTKDGGVMTGVVSDGMIGLSETGSYTITFESDDGENEYAIDLDVDAIKPKVEITQKKNQAIIGKADKEKVTYTLTRDGKSVDFTVGQPITQKGKYTLTVTDELGNSSEYSFELKYVNVYGKIVIAAFCLAVLGVVVIAVVARSRRRIG